MYLPLRSRTLTGTVTSVVLKRMTSTSWFASFAMDERRSSGFWVAGELEGSGVFSTRRARVCAKVGWATTRHSKKSKQKYVVAFLISDTSSGHLLVTRRRRWGAQGRDTSTKCRDLSPPWSGGICCALGERVYCSCVKATRGQSGDRSPHSKKQVPHSKEYSVS